MHEDLVASGSAELGPPRPYSQGALTSFWPTWLSSGRRPDASEIVTLKGGFHPEPGQVGSRPQWAWKWFSTWH